MSAGKIYIIYHGFFGEQIVRNLSKGLTEEIECVYELKPETIEKQYPSPDLWERIWDEPDRYLPKDMPISKCDLLLVLGIDPRLGDLIPPIAMRLGAKVVLYPIDDKNHVPQGKRTIETELRSNNIWIEFPEPFCYLHGSQNELVRRFLARFGQPEFRVELDGTTETIRSVEVLRDTPCGSASSTARKIVGFSYRTVPALKEKIVTEHRNAGVEFYCAAEVNPLNPYLKKADDKIVEKFFEACRKALQELGEFALLEDFYPV